MRRMVTILLVVAVGIVTLFVALCRQLPGDYFYDLVLDNQTPKAVEVYVDGERVGVAKVPVPACSQYEFPSASFQPGRPLQIEVRDLEGRTLLRSEQTPTPYKTSYDYRVFVVVPAGGDEGCIRTQATPAASSSGQMPYARGIP